MKTRLGGMALGNGVLVHGPTAWAAAIRTAEGELRVASGRKRVRSADAPGRLAQAPLRIAEVFAVFPAIRRALPEAELPFGRPATVAALAGGVLATRALRRSALGPLAQELLGALAAAVPAVASVRGSSAAAYHGAEHVSIGSYEHGEPRSREHERCGSHLLGPLLVTSAAGNLVAARAPAAARPAARLAAGVGALAASVELLGWMLRNERHPVSRALARPGWELQHRYLTAEPSPEQLEVAEAALAECLRLEEAV